MTFVITDSRHPDIILFETKNEKEWKVELAQRGSEILIIPFQIKAERLEFL